MGKRNIFLVVLDIFNCDNLIKWEEKELIFLLDNA